MKKLVITFLIALMPIVINAEQFKTFGDYTVHYSAFTTDTLPASIAKSYQIARSKNRIMVNLSILKNREGAMGEPVRTHVESTATNLSQQLRELNFREIMEQNAIYYIADTLGNNEETLSFNFIITPEGEDSSYTLTFQEKFFTK